MRIEWLGAALAVAALAACRTVPVPVPAGPAWEQRRAQLQARTRFELSGRVAVAAAGEGFNASLRWTQDGEHSQVGLQGPLGVGGVQVSASAGELQLVTSRGEHLDSDAARAALAARLGFDPPLKSLRYWVLGVPDPGMPADESLDTRVQRLDSLVQAGWRIDYTTYMSVGALALPSRLTLERDAVRVRLLVDDWQLP